MAETVGGFPLALAILERTVNGHIVEHLTVVGDVLPDCGFKQTDAEALGWCGIGRFFDVFIFILCNRSFL
jgi:hypothetical protein